MVGLKVKVGVYRWICPEGHPDYMATCNNRYSCNTGCPVCGMEKRGSSNHPTLAAGRPDLAAEWGPGNTVTPEDITLGSPHRAVWACGADPTLPTWEATVYPRALKGSGCPACASSKRFTPRKFGADEAQST